MSVNIHIPDHIKDAAKLRGINLSQLFRQTLEAAISTTPATTSLTLLRAEAALVMEEITERQARLNALQAKVREIEKQAKEEEIARLRQQEALELAATHCLECKGVLGGGAHSFAAGKVCRSCFLSAGKEKIKQWRGG